LITVTIAVCGFSSVSQAEAFRLHCVESEMDYFPKNRFLFI